MKFKLKFQKLKPIQPKRPPNPKMKLENQNLNNYLKFEVKLTTALIKT